MTRTMNWQTWMTVAAIAASVSGCNLFESSGSGTVRGRVVDANGQPISGARVALDKVGGRTTMSNVRGEFRLGGARDGAHTVIAYSVAQDAGGSIAADVTDGDVVDVGDVMLVDCDVVIAGGGVNEDGSIEPGSDPSIEPCIVEPPPPPAANVTIASLEGEYASGFVDPWGVYGFADDSSEMAGFDFWISADLTAGGSFSDHVVNDYANGLVEAHVGLFTYSDPNGWGYYYVLREGDITVSVTDDGDGDPSTLSFSFSGSNLVFDYADWNGGIDSVYTATVGNANAAGTAWQYIPPEPPTADITLPTFVADWKYISLCPQCGVEGGDLIFVYAYDETNQADLSLYAPVSSLTLGGSALLESNWESEVYGWASYYGDGNYWGYDLSHLTATAGSTLASGELFNLTLSEAQFDYIDAYGGGVVVMEGEGGSTDGNGGGDPSTPPAEPPTSELQLFIGSADLSAIVDEYTCGDGTEPSPGEPEPEGKNAGLGL